ncbi:actin binding lim protein 1 [Echinococcus multilocularis]|uniref:Actin binding lim protein 1 n=1 Tax=Echinococcus multilocularis TaxID=6211 RepID=A0A068YIX1_ECHMU|nr:actin binding lim protein 1 [Echinococcus multilocularis]
MGKVYCEVCKRRCKGNVLKANDKFFHKDCFKCSECKCSLKAGGFFLKNNKYFCQKDYQKLSAPKCKVCGEVLSGDIVSALSYSFHKGCFICSQCKTPFNPGNRVTVWKDEFYCVCCSQSLSSRQAAVAASGGKGPISPLSARQNHDNRQQPQSQQQPRLSFADYPSPVSFAEESMDSRITPPVQKTSGSILKSSLRQSRTMQSVSNAPNSRNSDFGGSVQLQQQKASATLPVGSFQGHLDHTSVPTSSTFSPQHSQSLHGSGRHPLSEYGRFYNLSYASIAEQPSRRLTDMYRRNALHTPATSNSISHLQHFHIPQGNRFPLEPNRIVPGGMSRTSRSFNSSLRDALMTQPSSAGHLTTVPVTSPTNGVGGAEGVTLSKRSTLVESEAASLEARRLASFPSGQPPDATLVPAIERYDWPAPASTAVMTAELMRERRQRLREQGVLQASSDESVEDLSIDTSVGSHCDLDRISGGIGRAILLEEERVRRKTRTAHLLDPVSASRSPNAKVEPPYKTRYATHSFASPSRESQRSSVSPHRLDYSLELVNLGNRVWTTSDHHRYRRNGTASHSPQSFRRAVRCNSTGLRPGYTAGQLSLSSAKTSSISGSHCFSSPRLDVLQANGHTNGKICEDAPIQSQTSPIRRNGHRVDDEATNLSQDFHTGLLGSVPSYSSVISSTPYTMSTKHEGSPAKEIPYKELVASLGRPPKGIDRTRLEMYLSDSEFEKVFQLSRVAFYRLPEWKRNDLKRRVDLF